MRIGPDEYRAVFWEPATQTVRWIEPRVLPHTLTIVASRAPEEVARAIETMQVRGAPSIGVVAALGLALAWQLDRVNFFDYWLQRFRRTRPTAVNLFHACDAMERLALQEPSANAMIECAVHYADAEVAANRRMGEHLAEVLAKGERRILTHCNAGWLAAVDWGTATSGIYHLARAGESPFVWVDETRPRLQGARLTAWELMAEGIACALQVDSAAAWMMAKGKVDSIVVGADRIAANGDVANKVGTYALSLAAKAHGVPMYIAAPSSTFDCMCNHGGDIPIEERNGEELTTMDGLDQMYCHRHVRVTTEQVMVNNPGFDVTPYENITAIISEKGVWTRGIN